ncbi:hypothetical protein E4T42_01688 [Aureobasidium subglaciale]|nr:hypothetical protein E4T42_01688 [Aureobasidium subglaciale]
MRRCLVESEEQFGYMMSVKSLLNNGFDANAGYDPNEDRAALYCASRYGHAETVRTLLDHGADVNAQDFVGGTALDVAAHEGQLHVIQLIINHTVHVNVSEGYHESALKAAAYNGHLRVVEHLLDVVDHMNIGTNRSRTGANGDQTDDLYAARAAGRIGPVRNPLEDHGAGNTSSEIKEIALRLDKVHRQPEIIQMLRNHGVIEFPHDRRHSFGTALAAAAHRRHTDIVRTLLRTNLNVDDAQWYRYCGSG